MELTETNGKLEIALPAVLDLPAACELRDILVDAVARDTGADTILDCARVERMSTAAIQVMISAGHAFTAAARRLDLEQPSAAMTQAFSQLGLSSALEQLVAT